MTDPVAPLQRLGLSKYEAEVFVALRRLEGGTAREVASTADVPRSQVYGAADALTERGLVDVQHATPKRYRAVSVETARERLREEFEREHDRAFEALSRMDASVEAGDERQEALWTLAGCDTVAARTTALVRAADARVVYGGERQRFEQELVDALRAVADATPVTVVSVDLEVLERFEDGPVETVALPEAFQRQDWPNGRFLVADDDTVLLSVVGPDGEESAFWSSDTDFAAGLTQLLDGYFGRVLDL